MEKNAEKEIFEKTIRDLQDGHARALDTQNEKFQNEMQEYMVQLKQMSASFSHLEQETKVITSHNESLELSAQELEQVPTSSTRT